MAIFQVRRFVFSVYVFECFILVRVCELVVKAVYKFTYKQVLVSICQRSIASKALKGFCWFLFIFNGTLLKIQFFDWLLSRDSVDYVRLEAERAK